MTRQKQPSFLVSFRFTVDLLLVKEVSGHYFPGQYWISNLGGL